MKWTFVRYRTKTEKANENARLIGKVFRELTQEAPKGTHYLVLQVAEDTFVHVVALEDGGISPTAFPAFRAFQEGIKERCVEQPIVSTAAMIGNYRMLGETLPIS
jgi:hypothetical protein